jgi:hypothetical protein
MRSTFFPLTLLLLAACARSEDASTLPMDSNGSSTAVEQVRPTAQETQDIAIGEWRQSLQDDVQALEFGPEGTPPLFSLRCDERRGVLLQRHGVPPEGDLPMMLVTIGNETRRLAITNVGGTVPMLRAALTPRDPLLRQLGQVSTPITVRIGDTPPLVLPPNSVIGDFVSRCGGNTGAGPAEANQAEPEENAAAPANESAPAR